MASCAILSPSVCLQDTEKLDDFQDTQKLVAADFCIFQDTEKRGANEESASTHLAARVPLDEIGHIVHPILIRHPHSVLHLCVLGQVRPSVQRHIGLLSGRWKLPPLLRGQLWLLIFVHQSRGIARSVPALSDEAFGQGLTWWETTAAAMQGTILGRT